MVTVTAASGGKGTVWLDDLTLEELPPATSQPPPATATASSAAPGSPPQLAFDGNPSTSWRSGSRVAGSAALFDRPRPAAGIRRPGARVGRPRFPAEILGRGLGRREGMVSSQGGLGIAGETRVPVPSRFPIPASSVLKLAESARLGRGTAFTKYGIRPPEFSDTPTAFLQNVARDAPRARGRARSRARDSTGRSLEWTAAATRVSCPKTEALETGRGGFSLEPFLWTGGSSSAGAARRSRTRSNTEICRFPR
jgi:hypothetical protein